MYEGEVAKPPETEFLTSEVSPKPFEFPNHEQIVRINTLRKRLKETTAKQIGFKGNGCKLKIFTSSPTDFTVHGVGLQLYFVLLKCLICLFFVLSLVSIYVLVNNYTQNGFEDSNGGKILVYFTVANLNGFSKNNSSSEATPDQQLEKINQNLRLLYISDVICCIIFVVFIIWYLRYSYKIL
jgi:hypothetical protein